MRMRCVPAGSFPVRSAVIVRKQPGGEADVVADALPRSVGELRLEIRDDDLHLRLIGRVHRRRGEVVGEAAHQQVQRARRRSTSPRSSSSACSVAKPLNGASGKRVDEAAIRLAKRRQQVVPLVVPRAVRQSRAAARRASGPRGTAAPRRSTRSGWLSVPLGMVDREQPHLIEVVDLLHRLDEVKRQHAVA